MRKTVLSIFMLGTLFLPALSFAELISGIAAVVNDEIITIRELNREFDLASKEIEKKEGPLSYQAKKKLRVSMLDSMVDRFLVRQKIKELNIVVSEEEVRQSIEDVKKQNRLSQEALVSALLSQGMTFDQYKAQLKEQLERLRLMSQEVKSKIQVSEREIREYYDANPSLYKEDATFRAKHIFLKVSKTAPNTDVKDIIKKAVLVISEARSNSDFAALARKYSDDPGAAKDGGDLGSFKKGDMLPEIESAVINMKPGEISEIVTSPLGFHIIKLEERSAEKMKLLESVKASIEEILYKKKSEERFKQWAEELRKGAAVELKPSQ